MSVVFLFFGLFLKWWCVFFVVVVVLIILSLIVFVLFLFCVGVWVLCGGMGFVA
jgi:hypothetical protein